MEGVVLDDVFVQVANIKDFRDIQERIKDTVDVEFILKPVYNFKAS